MFACQHEMLLQNVLRTRWGIRGRVMSEYGANHSTVDSATNGLDAQACIVDDTWPTIGLDNFSWRSSTRGGAQRLRPRRQPRPAGATRPGRPR